MFVLNVTDIFLKLIFDKVLLYIYIYIYIYVSYELLLERRFWWKYFLVRQTKSEICLCFWLIGYSADHERGRLGAL